MKLSNEILILSPIESVWKTTVEIEKWHKWTPTVEKASLEGTDFTVGSKARIKQPGMKEAVWTVIDLTHEKEFTWETKTLGLRMIATHRLSEEEANQTCNFISLEIRGFLGVVLWPFLKERIKKSLAEENLGLKKYCENRRH